METGAARKLVRELVRVAVMVKMTLMERAAVMLRVAVMVRVVVMVRENDEVKLTVTANACARMTVTCWCG